MAHEIVEHNHGLDNVVLIGLQTGGVPLAGLLADDLRQIEDVELPVGTLDVAFYRDDIGLRPVLPEAVTDIPFDLERQDRRAGRRRAVHRPHDPGRARRPHRLRPAPGRCSWR